MISIVENGRSLQPVTRLTHSLDHASCCTEALIVPYVLEMGKVYNAQIANENGSTYLYNGGRLKDCHMSSVHTLVLSGILALPVILANFYVARV